MSSTQSLPTVVKALEDKAKTHKQAENTQFHVSVAKHNISEVNSVLNDLIKSLEDLQYYKTVLEEALDDSAPTMTSSARQTAKKAAEATQEELLENAQSGEITGDKAELNSSTGRSNPKVELTPEIEKQIEQIRSAKRQVDNVIEQIERQIGSKQEKWNTKINAAEELQKILGVQNRDFSRTLNHMHELLNKELMNSRGSASNFVSQWKNAMRNWEKHQSLQSFGDFQKKHGLSDSTVEDVKTLSQSRKLTLADVSLDTVEEMKRVGELESAVELSL